MMSDQWVSASLVVFFSGFFFFSFFLWSAFLFFDFVTETLSYMSLLSRCIPRRGVGTTSGKKTPLPQPVYIVGSARTPMGSYGGALKNLSATDLGSIAVSEAISRSKVKSVSHASQEACFLSVNGEY
mmetsp:Transcript_6606/g.9523  ORF Transcript_6606/g.9523 Transcript_6606/m.9523 type:complete len:127 (+) Transcript_6606:86-466(+)